MTDRQGAAIEYLAACEAIRQLRARYSWHAHRGEWREIANLFTEDGVFDAIRPSGEHMLWQGRELIFANLAERDAAVMPIISNEIIEVDGDHASGTCTMLSTASPDPQASGFIGNYHDEMRRVDGRWLFSRRRFEALSGSF